MTISVNIIELLKESKNLLAFSHQIDSTALFYTLLDLDIPFDVAIVDYQTRSESKKEIASAQALCQKYNKKIFIKTADKITKNFEANARKIRYSFFEQTIEDNGYINLLTGHQLNDRLEWFLMQFSKGAGICELRGMEFITKEEKYNIVRPLLDYSKDEILEYLKDNNYEYFIDSTNIDKKYKRNFIRSNFSDSFLKEYKNGIKKSFEYISKDCNFILKDFNYKKIKECYILEKKSSLVSIKEIELVLKKLGYILSKPQKDEIQKENDCVVGGKFAISFANSSIYINPFVDLVMEKKFKELCRKLKVPKKLRTYLFKENIEPNKIKDIMIKN